MVGNPCTDEAVTQGTDTAALCSVAVICEDCALLFFSNNLFTRFFSFRTSIYPTSRVQPSLLFTLTRFGIFISSSPVSLASDSNS